MAEEIWETLIKAFSLLFTMILILGFIPFVEGLAHVVGLSATSTIAKDIGSLATIIQSSPNDIAVNYTIRIQNTKTTYHLTGIGKKVLITERVVNSKGEIEIETFEEGIPIDLIFNECGPIQKIQVKKGGGNFFIKEISDPNAEKICFAGRV